MRAADGARERVTACLIVQDEQERLPHALASVAFCDELVVVDGGSHDDTVAIARAAGAHVVENPWPGYAAQRNIALDAAEGDWILEVDADERVSPQLRASIEALLRAPSDGRADMAVFALRNRFLGGLLGPSAKYPAYRSRLFRRGAYRHDESRGVHEGVEPRERPIVLEGDLEHELAATAGEALRDMWRYARLESTHLDPAAGPASYVVGIVLRPAAKLAYRTIVDGGWRDGWRGIAKIALDATSDALVWIMALARRIRGGGDRTEVSITGPAARAHAGVGVNPAHARAAGSFFEHPTPTSSGTAPPTPPRAPTHFGRRPVGSPKVVVVASGEDATRAAERWLDDLRARGLDVALLSDRPALLEDSRVPCGALPRVGPLILARALDVEMQVRTIDAVVPAGARARLALRLVPGTLRPTVGGLNVGVEPARATELAGAQRR